MHDLRGHLLHLSETKTLTPSVSRLWIPSFQSFRSRSGLGARSIALITNPKSTVG